jgi:hypothetical protein
MPADLGSGHSRDLQYPPAKGADLTDACNTAVNRLRAALNPPAPTWSAGQLEDPRHRQARTADRLPDVLRTVASLEIYSAWR